MAKDFAHRGNGGRQTASRRGMPGWLWLLVGVALGFAGAVAYYISRPAQVQAVARRTFTASNRTIAVLERPASPTAPGSVPPAAGGDAGPEPAAGSAPR